MLYGVNGTNAGQPEPPPHQPPPPPPLQLTVEIFIVFKVLLHPFTSVNTTS